MAWEQLPDSFRCDDYENVMNKVGTSQDNSTAYNFMAEPSTTDMQLTNLYEAGGLFAKIIDAPAEEAVKHGFELGLEGSDAEKFIMDKLEMLEFEDKVTEAIKFSRLYGGALGVMLIDDGGDIDEPLNWKRIRDIDEIRIYERSVVYPDYTGVFNFDPKDPVKSPTPQFGMPEYYYVQSVYGQFWVHASRCLVFKNGKLPERTMNPNYRFWGMPEYARIKRELREYITTHSLSVKLLERSVQAIFTMHGLSRLLATEEGDAMMIRRLQQIDMARHAINSIAIDSEGEDYKFQTTTLAGVKEVVESSSNALSAVSNIPQTILYGMSPAGQNSTGESDFENWYNYVERYQKLMLRPNYNTMIDVITKVGFNTGVLEEAPEFKLKFNPLWSMSATEEAEIEAKKAATQQIKAQTAEVYFNIGSLDPSEIRRGLAQDGEYVIEELLDEDDVGDDLWGSEDLPEDPVEPGDIPAGETGECREV